MISKYEYDVSKDPKTNKTVFKVNIL